MHLPTPSVCSHAGLQRITLPAFYPQKQPLALHPLVALCLTILVCSFAGGCSFAKKQPVSPGKQSVQLFTPLDQKRTYRISPDESKKLVNQLSLQRQGLSGWNDLSFPLSQSLDYASRRPASSVAIEQPGLTLTFSQLTKTLQHMQKLLPRLNSNPELLATEFTWYRIGPDFSVTGYYEPTLRASRTKTAQYHYPLYRLPSGIKKGVPYHSRNAIDRRGVLKNKGLEIAWVDSEAEAFFLHIQGSGRLLFPDGSVTHILYAGKNNQAYNALGRIMKEEGLLAPDNISMQSIKEVLTKYPERCEELFDKNPSYVFFREASKGPVGGMGRPLTPWVSTAVDRSVLAYGSVTFLVTPLPDNTGAMNIPFYGLMLPQDTGGAIKRNKVDLFCGPGDTAEHTAGYLNTPGAMYILVKK